MSHDLMNVNTLVRENVSTDGAGAATIRAVADVTIINMITIVFIVFIVIFGDFADHFRLFMVK